MIRERPHYVLVRCEKSHCPGCLRTVTMIQHRIGGPRMASFYICFNCQRVFEVGVAEVTKER
jgi:hypothetical protein